ncbi:glycosyl hydrolase family 18 protein [Methylococcus mesophilus]|uniref:glycosyl hydrolase family 18 protein n=1 Tax=Methylococcus mesophilus TaxID=2993564 RepID=UPI00224AEF8E|nr:glycosyl hydrolase family 18 protein [Methylococcus mesophilus]UZR28800.1 glycosyl hydrolase family 18 protein [Methylococcus mesophilus]
MTTRNRVARVSKSGQWRLLPAISLSAMISGPALAACPDGQWVAEYFANTSLAGAPVLVRCEDGPPNYFWDQEAPVPGLSPDAFSVRWTGSPAFSEGTATFTTYSDDGVRVTVDGARVIDNWTYHAFTQNTGTAQLTAGNHSVAMEFFEGGGGAVAQLVWQEGGEPSPTPPPPPPSCSDGEWRAEYFNSTDLSGTPVLVQCENGPPNHSWDGAPAPGLSPDAFSVRWTGTPSFAGGDVKFDTYSDDGIRVLVDGAPVIDNWTYHAPAADTAVVPLTAGTHSVVLEFFEGGGGALAQLVWQDGGSPPPPPAPQIVSFTATPSSIAAGASSTLAWQAENADACSASGGWTGYRATAGTESVQPAVTTIYTLTCTNAGARSATASISVTVTGPAPLPAVTGLSATVAGSTLANLSWNPATPNGSGKWVTGYYAGYFWDWNGGDPAAAVAAVDMSTMTHFVFGRYAPGGGVMAGSPGQVVPAAGTGNDPAVEDALIAKAHANGVKALMMLGGATDGDGFIASTQTSSVRAVFIRNILDQLAAKHYDGVDIDWEEYLGPEVPNQPNGRAPLLALLSELRAAAAAHPYFQAPHNPLVITFPGFWVNNNFADAVEPWHVQVAALVDQYNLMTYGMAGPWGWDSWHFSPLAGAAPYHPTSIESSVQKYVAAGVPRTKLGIGIGLYGLYYDSPVSGPRQPHPEDRDWSMNFADTENHYARLVEEGAFNQPGGVYHWDEEAKQSYYTYEPAWDRGRDRVGFLSYEDERSIAAKGRWVRDNGVGGTIVWTINYGYLPSTGNNPMMDAIKAAFLGGAPSDVVGYHVYRDGVLVASVTGTDFQDSGLTPGTQYSYAVAAYDSTGREGPPSAPVIVTTPSAQ